MISQHTFNQTVEQVNNEFTKLQERIETLEKKLESLEKPKAPQRTTQVKKT